MKIASLPQEALLSPLKMRVLAAAFLLGAAALHIPVASEHLEEGWTYGLFFLLVAAGQGLYALGLLASRVQVFRSPWYLVVGIAGSFMFLGLYLVSRLVGLGSFGAHAGHVHAEPFGPVDVTSKILEQAVAAVLIWLLVDGRGTKDAFRFLVVSSGLGLLGAAALVAMAGLQVDGEERPPDLLDRLASQPVLPSGVGGAGGPAVSQGSTSPDLPTFRELLPLFMRSGNGTPPATADVIYAPALYFQLAGEEAPQASLDRPTAAFYLLEMEHDHLAPLAPAPPPALLRLDRNQPVEPYEVTVLSQEPYHRTSRLLFPLPAGMDPESLNEGRHTFTILLLLGSSGESAFTWELPLDLPKPQPTSQPAPAPRPDAAALARLLTRTRKSVGYGGVNGTKVEATYVTPEYSDAALSRELARRFLPDERLVFLVSETAHGGGLPASPPAVTLRLEGQARDPDLVQDIAVSRHHRVSLVRFAADPPRGLRHRVMELTLPEGERLVWHLPLGRANPKARSFPLGAASVLALLGGFLASMWPCLFQLTAYFIPSLAGVGMQHAPGGDAGRRRVPVLKAALLFVLGFTLVYTASGAAIGYVAQRVADTSAFEVWQRYLGVGAGAMVLVLALRVAARARAPLVCKMPVLSRLAHRKTASHPMEMMVAGLAFATGCMTCFGSAVIIAMVAYVGLAASPLYGAAVLFLFSLGMAVPLVIGALAMAKVLPLLFRLEKLIPWMGLASSVVMAGFAALLISGNYMAVTEWAYRLLP